MGPARMLRLCSLALLLALASGCTRQPTPLLPFGGKVSFKGAQLPGGLIVFTPDAGRGGSGPIAFGTIRADGAYTLFTGNAEGASAGWYRISVASFSPAQPPADHVPLSTSLLPERYRDPGLSLLVCEVKPDRANQLDFNLD
jgi:hypothetical protein